MQIILVGLIGLVTSFLSNVSGGGGALILLPALITIGLPPLTAIGTIKVGSLGLVAGSIVSSRGKGIVRKDFLGDDLVRFWSGSSMRGIDVELPKEMPHIYLDGHANNRQLGQRFFIDKKHLISLEGGFDRYFQAYVPDNYTSLVLSLLSPDVMQTMMDTAAKYDVEIYGSHLRIITNKRVFNRPAREAELLKIAHVVMREVAHRLHSWSKHDSSKAHNAHLTVYTHSGQAIGRLASKNNLIVASIFFAILSSFFYWSGYGWQASGRVGYALLNYCFAVLFFPGSLLILLLTARNNGMKSR